MFFSKAASKGLPRTFTAAGWRCSQYLKQMKTIPDLMKWSNLSMELEVPTYHEDGGHPGDRLGKLLSVICQAYSARTRNLGHYTLKELQDGVHLLQLSFLDTLRIPSLEVREVHVFEHKNLSGVVQMGPTSQTHLFKRPTVMYCRLFDRNSFHRIGDSRRKISGFRRCIPILGLAF